jgi:hypothetical protein
MWGMWCKILFVIRDDFHNIVTPMAAENPESIGSATRVVNVDSVNPSSKSLFAGRTFGAGVGNKTFMTKEVMSALDKKGLDKKDVNSGPEDASVKE